MCLYVCVRVTDVFGHLQVTARQFCASAKLGHARLCRVPDVPRGVWGAGARVRACVLACLGGGGVCGSLVTWVYNDISILHPVRYGHY